MPHCSLKCFWECYTSPMDTNFCEHVLNLLRYYRINSKRYTNMKRYRDISPQSKVSPSLEGPEIQVQAILSVSFIEYINN
jgi:hypothetical protein